jgi:hypothetical protein
MLTIRISDPSPAPGGVNEDITISMGQHRTVVLSVPSAQLQGPRAFQVGMTITELLSDAVTRGLHL